jgi:hypothetical protein
MTDDIVDRLRKWTHDVTGVPASDLMDEAAAVIKRLRALADRRGTLAVDRRREIERLRSRAVESRETVQCPYVVGRTTRYCSLTPFTLTDEERVAVRKAAEVYSDNDDDEECARIAATLRSLLERCTPDHTGAPRR